VELASNATTDTIFSMDFVTVLVHYATPGIKVQEHAQPVSVDTQFQDMVVCKVTIMTMIITVDLLSFKNFHKNKK
jgi:hypothetical protein